MRKVLLLLLLVPVVVWAEGVMLYPKDVPPGMTHLMGQTWLPYHLSINGQDIPAEIADSVFVESSEDWGRLSIWSKMFYRDLCKSRDFAVSLAGNVVQ